MDRIDCDIFISGGGIAGQVAAASFAARGFTVVLADPVPPVTEADLDGSDLRSTAFLQPARDLFAACGLWDLLEPFSKPLDQLQIIDTTGWPPVERDRRIFQASDMSDDPFGWNLMNWLVRRELWTYLQNAPGITALYGTGFKRLVNRTDEVLITLTDGQSVRARLAVAADGKFSPLREAAGIGVSTTRYGQKSLAFTVTHDVPHDNISTEIYNVGGPFTIVPLPDVDGAHASAIVWMNKGPRSVELMTMAVPAFEDVMQARSVNLLGRLRLKGRRSIWPIITQTADRMAEGRVAVLGEAAHALPPIGAQGLNTSLNDLIELLEAIDAGPGDPGDAATLDRYARAREVDVRRRARAIDLFNRVAGSGDAGVQAMRLFGLRTFHDVTPLRKRIMRAGLGPD